MKVDKSVQGAADKLLGLLNPQEGQSEPKKDQPAPQEQTEPVKTEPVAEEVSKSETEEAKPEAESSETQTETEQTEEQEIQKLGSILRSQISNTYRRKAIVLMLDKRNSSFKNV